MQESDFPYFWAAYDQGVWNGIIADGLGSQGFDTAFLDMLSTIYDRGGMDRVVASDKPLGLFLGLPMAGELGIEVGVDWMPWVTTRQKLEATAYFLRDTSRRVKVFVWSRADGEGFYQRLARYRMLCRGGKVKNLYGAEADGRMYYTAGPF